MLCTRADSLYWMSRYLERAEHTTRLLDVNLNLMLDEARPARSGAGSGCCRRWAGRRMWSGRAIRTTLTQHADL